MSFNLNKTSHSPLTATIYMYSWGDTPGEDIAIQNEDKAEKIFSEFKYKIPNIRNEVRILRDNCNINYFKLPLNIGSIFFLFIQEQADLCSNKELNALCEKIKKTFARLYYKPLEKKYTQKLGLLVNNFSDLIERGNVNLKKIAMHFSNILSVPYWDLIPVAILFDHRANLGNLEDPGEPFKVGYSSHSVVEAIHHLGNLIKHDYEWILTKLSNDNIVNKSNFRAFNSNCVALINEITELDLLDINQSDVIASISEMLISLMKKLDSINIPEKGLAYLLDPLVTHRLDLISKLLEDLASSYAEAQDCISNGEEMSRVFTAEEIEQIAKIDQKSKKKKKKKTKKINKSEIVSSNYSALVSASQKHSVNNEIELTPMFKGGTAALLAAKATNYFLRQPHEGFLMRNIIWSLDHLDVLQQQLSADFKPEYNLTLFTTLIGTSSRVLELAYRHLSGAPFKGHNLQEIYKEFRPGESTPQIVDRLVSGNRWYRFFFSLKGKNKILNELIKTANNPEHMPQERFKKMLIDLHQDVVAEVERQLNLQTSPMLGSLSEQPLLENFEAIIGIVNEMHEKVSSLLEIIMHRVAFLHLKQSIAEIEMLKTCLKELQIAKNDKIFAFWSVQALAHLQGGIEQLLHTLEVKEKGVSTKTHQIKNLAGSLGMDVSKVNVFNDLSKKSRYPAEFLLEDNLSARIIDGSELIAQGYGNGFKFIGEPPKILWKLPLDHEHFNRETLMYSLVEILAIGYSFIKEEIFPKIEI